MTHVLIVAALLMPLLSTGALAQSSGASIVEEALEGVREDQARDADRVRRMVDEAVQGSEAAQSGRDTVNPQAPETLRRLADPRAPGALPVGYQVEDLLDRPVEDGTGTRIGVVRDLVLDEASGIARAMVAFEPMFDQPGKTAVVPIESLTTATARGSGYVMQLTSIAFARMPAYVRREAVWRRQDG